MSTTILPQKPPALKADVNPQEVLDAVYEEFLRTYGDYDKSGDMESSHYYGGQVDAYHNVILQLTGVNIQPGDE